MSAAGEAVLEVPDGTATLLPDGPGAFRLTVQPASEAASWGSTVRTTYPPELVDRILAVKGLGVLCDELRREEDPMYVRHVLEHGLFGFVAPEWFASRRVLDFGSGGGSSTIVLADLLPRTRLVGVELEPTFVALSRERAAFRGVDADFHVSPAPDRLPADLGRVDAVVLSAVWEHLLPAERGPLLALLWDALAPGGYLFVNQLPHRWSPYDHHTTGLWGVSLLPDRLAAAYARGRSPRDLDGYDWETLLRMGIRGGSLRELSARLRAVDPDAEVVAPRGPRRDHADLWLAFSSERAASRRKRVAHVALKAIERATGEPVNKSLMAAFRKPG